MFAGWFGASQPAFKRLLWLTVNLTTTHFFKKKKSASQGEAVSFLNLLCFLQASKPSGVDHQFKAELALEKSSRTWFFSRPPSQTSYPSIPPGTCDVALTPPCSSRPTETVPEAAPAWFYAPTMSVKAVKVFLFILFWNSTVSPTVCSFCVWLPAWKQDEECAWWNFQVCLVAVKWKTKTKNVSNVSSGAQLCLCCT